MEHLLITALFKSEFSKNPETQQITAKIRITFGFLETKVWPLKNDQLF